MTEYFHSEEHIRHDEISIRLKEHSRSYEELRASNIRRNASFLAAIGITSAQPPAQAPIHQRKKRRKTAEKEETKGGGGGGGGTEAGGGGLRRSMRDTRVDAHDATAVTLNCPRCKYITHPKGPIAAEKELTEHLNISTACGYVETQGAQCIEIAPRAR